MSYTPSSAASTAATGATRDAQANLLANNFIPGATSTTPAGGTTVLTNASTRVQIFTGGSAGQIVTLPTTGIAAGHSFKFVNPSSSAITINASAGAGVASLATNAVVIVTAKVATPTLSTDWQAEYMTVFTPSSSATAGALALRNGQGNLLADAFVPGLTSTTTSAGTLVLTNDSTQDQRFTGSTTHTLTLPTTSITAGMYFDVWNQSSGAITINASGGALVKTLAGTSYTRVKAMIATPTVAADWFAT